MTNSAASSALELIDDFMAVLQDAVGERHRLLGPALFVSIWTRVSFVRHRIAHLVRRLLEGTPRRRRAAARRRAAKPAAPTDPHAAKPERRRARSAPLLPRAWGWLGRFLPAAPGLRHSADALRAEFERRLAHPDMAALVTRDPQLRALMRSVCRMLGVDRETLTPALQAALALPMPRAASSPREGKARSARGEAQRWARAWNDVGSKAWARRSRSTPPPDPAPAPMADAGPDPRAESMPDRSPVGATATPPFADERDRIVDRRGVDGSPARGPMPG